MRSTSTNQDILTKAIERAQANGWLPGFIVKRDRLGWTMTGKGAVEVTGTGVTAPVTYMLSEFDIIYDHDFAKALWGETVLLTGYLFLNGELDYETLNQPHWMSHLQRMVIADDPIKYLGENI